MPVHSDAEAVTFLRTGLRRRRLDLVLLNFDSGPALKPA